MRALFVGTAITLLSASFALAADLGQYRPGNPYQSVIAPGADVCESHCAGDAQCRSWNYIKASPQAAGVCEFNSNDAAPVASAISISGTNAVPTYRSGVVTGGTNTIRVGTQTVTRPKATTERISPTRRVVRQAVPQQRQAQPASTRPIVRPADKGSLTAQQNQYRQQNVPNTPQAPTVATRPTIPQQFKYDLGGQGIVMSQPPQAQRIPQRPPVPQGVQYQRSGYAPQAVQSPKGQMTSRDRRRQQGPAMQRSEQMQRQQQQGQAFPPQMAPQQQAYAPPQQMIRRSATQPITHQNAQQQNGVVPYGQKNRPQGLTVEQAQQSLFGKLNDDVSIPNTAGPVPQDPNAPIATSSSRPVFPVEQGVLNDLAGAPKP